MVKLLDDRASQATGLPHVVWEAIQQPARKSSRWGRSATCGKKF